MMDWTEKYRPQSLDDVIGNPGAVSTLKMWAESWNNGIPEKRAVVLIGTPGIGKTTSAEALARDMGWSIIEMNASDQRNADAIEDVAFAVQDSTPSRTRGTIWIQARVRGSSSYWMRRITSSAMPTEGLFRP